MARALLSLEAEEEQRFIRAVILNVDIAGLSSFSTRGGNIESTGFDWYVNTFYPMNYPAVFGDAAEADFLHELASAGSSAPQYLESLGYIGACVTQWPPPGWEH